MKINFRTQLTFAVLGVLGVGFPATLINQVTANTDPAFVLIGVLIASIVGYGYGAYTVEQAGKVEVSQAYADGFAEGVDSTFKEPPQEQVVTEPASHPTDLG